MAAVIWSAAVAVDPANATAVTAVDTDVTVPGVKVGDLVIAIPPATLEAGLAPQTATVTAANTVRVRITNASAGAINGASLTWTFLVFRLAPSLGAGEGIAWAG